MFEPFLTRVLTRSGHDVDGCGMSTRPEFYSGRGAITADLNSAKLSKIHTAILQNKGESEARQFALMVAAIPVLTATDFLITLYKLQQRNWIWDPNLLGTQKGIYAGDFASAQATVYAVLAGDSERDETIHIRASFLREHKVEEPRAKEAVYDQWGYGGCSKHRAYPR